jgi:hypothetical protein
MAEPRTSSTVEPIGKRWLWTQGFNEVVELADIGTVAAVRRRILELLDDPEKAAAVRGAMRRGK